ncbi:glutathione-dependent formaldehyde-activating enzyme [Aureobasidium pullulans]|nr:glutathione-dependent formaldehyde-activating enzyme [Aureobasidium pullulans]
MSFKLHPLIDNGLKKGSESFSGGTLSCHCPSEKVTVSLSSNVLHNHACGCSKCWKPSSAIFSIVGVIPTSNLSITANASKLHIVDASAPIQRHACKSCGVHMFGRIEIEHAFKGLDFVHVELSGEEGWQEPQFAAFVSSVVEQGLVAPEDMEGVRGQLKGAGLETYDALSPGLMDAIATFVAKKNGAEIKHVEFASLQVPPEVAIEDAALDAYEDAAEEAALEAKEEAALDATEDAAEEAADDAPLDTAVENAVESPVEKAVDPPVENAVEKPVENAEEKSLENAEE